MESRGYSSLMAQPPLLGITRPLLLAEAHTMHAFAHVHVHARVMIGLPRPTVSRVYIQPMCMCRCRLHLSTHVHTYQCARSLRAVHCVCVCGAGYIYPCAYRHTYAPAPEGCSVCVRAAGYWPAGQSRCCSRASRAAVLRCISSPCSCGCPPPPSPPSPSDRHFPPSLLRSGLGLRLKAIY